MALAIAALLAIALLTVGGSSERAAAAAAGSISGTVTLPAGMPETTMNHVIVAAEPATSTSGGQYAMTNPDPKTGKYTLPDLADGQYIVQFYAVELDGTSPDLVREYYKDTTERSLAAPLSVTPGAAITGINASLDQGGRITGRVSLPAGAPASWLHGVQVSASPVSVGSTSGGFAWVDPTTGAYSLVGLGTGDYRVQFMVSQYRDDATQAFVAPNLISEYYADTTDYMAAAAVPVTAGVTTANIDAALASGGVITGKVTLPPGVPSSALASAFVSAQPSGLGGSYSSAVVNPSTGTYTIAGLQTGGYRVQFSVSDPSVNLISEYYNNTYDYNSAQSVQASAGQTVTGIDARLEVGARVSGKVTLPSGMPATALKGVRVIATSAAGTGSTYVWANVEPSDGSYTIDKLPPGTYRVQFEGSQGYDSGTGTPIPAANVVTSFVDGVTLSAGQSRTGVNAALAKGATISGTASFPAGTEFAYLSVVSAATGERLSVGSSVNLTSGAFAIDRLPAGNYYIFASASQILPGGQYLSGSQFLRSSGSKYGVTVAAAGTATVNTAAVANSGAITGTLTASGFTGNAAENTYLGDTVVYQKLDTGWVALPEAERGSAQTNGTTPYSIPGLAAGTYTVGFEKSQTPYSAATSVVPEWWQRKSSLAGADPITLTAGQTKAGIDGTVRSTTAAPATGFTDVSGTPGTPTYSQFATEITWMAQQGISTGYEVGGKKEYRPFGTVTRDAMAAFLYRAAGSPAYTAPAVSPFSDVTPASPFYKEITWLAAQGISTGWATPDGKKEFRPFANITRDAMAAFLYRFAGEPDVTLPNSSPFTDVATDNGFYKEISWLAQQQISTGWDAAGGKKEFRPYNAITRDAMAAFLYRYSQLE